jgi:dihydrofolate reductase
MDIILIAAITADGYIARHSNETVEWTLDLHLFKEQTMGWPVIMGSNTKKTLNTDLSGRKEIVIHRDDIPKQILSNIKTEKCFVIGGGKTNTLFSPYLTHMYLTFHPLVFAKGVKLFSNLKDEMELTLLKVVPVINRKNLYQFQYKINK